MNTTQKNWILGCIALIFLLVPLAHAKVFTQSTKDPRVEKRIEQLLSKMTLAEKIGQMTLRDWGIYDSHDKIAAIKEYVRQGTVGGFLNIPRNALAPDAFDELQKIAVEKSPQGIPLIFGHDVIHGYKTIFPIPLGQAAAWNAKIVERGARVAALEATSVGIRWTFAPMVDISRDARWGRIAESLGEDVYLASELARAMVKGFHGIDLSYPTSLAACAKHFAAYGAAEGGRDYNTVNMSERRLRDVYLPPFKAAIEAGAPSLMTAYNELNGIPATAHRQLLTDILRKEWGFSGFVVSDWNSVMEMIPHGHASDAAHAARLAVRAGTDFEMASDAYEKYLPRLVKRKRVRMHSLDQAVRRMLRVKFAMGLFKSPYADRRRRSDILNDRFLADAKRAAVKSFVLLQNNKNVLPLSAHKSVAVIGPLAEVPYQQMGTWVYEGNKKDSRTFLPALKAHVKNPRTIHYAQGLPYSRSYDERGFAAARAAARKSDVVLFFGGEEAILSGEGHSRGNISLPGAQKKLLTQLAALKKPIVLVILAGRPISLEGLTDKVDAIMMAWHPGTMGGPALVDVLYGQSAPSGRLPVTWPQSSGQIPIYYDHKATGRPPTDENYTRMHKIDPKTEWQHAPGNSSNLLDYGHRPLYPFGYGISYTTFRYEQVKMRRPKIKMGGDIHVSLRVKNTGTVAATETVQLYIRDRFASVTRPVKQLKRFRQVHLNPGQKRIVQFKLSTADLAFHDQSMRLTTEPGNFDLWVAQHAADERHHFTFTVAGRQ